MGFEKKYLIKRCKLVTKINFFVSFFLKKTKINFIIFILSVDYQLIFLFGKSKLEKKQMHEFT